MVSRRALRPLIVRLTVDSNVFVYLADEASPLKQRTAAQVVARLHELDCMVGLQVIGEVQNAVRRRLKRPAADAHDIALAVRSTFRTFAYDKEDVSVALAAMRGGTASYWDGLLVSAARRAGCDALISEDMRDGGRILGVQVVNPFAPEGLSKSVRSLLNL